MGKMKEIEGEDLADEIKLNNGTTMENKGTETLGVTTTSTLADQQTAMSNIIEQHIQNCQFYSTNSQARMPMHWDKNIDGWMCASWVLHHAKVGSYNGLLLSILKIVIPNGSVKVEYSLVI